MTARTARTIFAVVYSVFVVRVEGSRRWRRLKKRTCGGRVPFLACGGEVEAGGLQG
jgi:hypothetical protein